MSARQLLQDWREGYMNRRLVESWLCKNRIKSLDLHLQQMIWNKIFSILLLIATTAFLLVPAFSEIRTSQPKTIHLAWVGITLAALLLGQYRFNGFLGDASELCRIFQKYGSMKMYALFMDTAELKAETAMILNLLMHEWQKAAKYHGNSRLALRYKRKYERAYLTFEMFGLLPDHSSVQKNTAPKPDIAAKNGAGGSEKVSIR